LVWEDKGRWFGAIADENGIVRLEWSDYQDDVTWFISTHARGKPDDKTLTHLEQLRDEVKEYLRKKRTVFNVPLAPDGTDFQRRVWLTAAKIPYGTTCSYGELAKKVGSPNAARAVGQTMRSNPIGIVIPCHRVIASDGTIGGFGGGTDDETLNVKREMLEFEGYRFQE
jgi:methylated-DNA-[protein]-cysteine S-methyltransferase